MFVFFFHMLATVDLLSTMTKNQRYKLICFASLVIKFSDYLLMIDIVSSILFQITLFFLFQKHREFWNFLTFF